MSERTTLARYLDLSTVPSAEDAAPIPVCVLRKETHNQHGLCLQPSAPICDVPLTSTSYAFQGWKKHCLSLFSFQGGINASHPFLPPPERSRGNWTAGRQGALTQAFAGTLGSRPPPRPVVEERETLFTVDPVGVMLAVTHQLVMLILHTLACVSVTFTPGERRDTQR